MLQHSRRLPWGNKTREPRARQSADQRSLPGFRMDLLHNSSVSGSRGIGRIRLRARYLPAVAGIGQRGAASLRTAHIGVELRIGVLSFGGGGPCCSIRQRVVIGDLRGCANSSSSWSGAVDAADLAMAIAEVTEARLLH